MSESTTPMIKRSSPQATFSALREILIRYAPRLDVQQDATEAYSLNAAYSEKWKKVVFFGSAQVKKNYVSYYLFPVYMYPDLLDDISPELRARMQGKSCFNFRSITAEQRAELEALTRRGFERFEAEGLVRDR